MSQYLDKKLIEEHAIQMLMLLGQTREQAIRELKEAQETEERRLQEEMGRAWWRGKK